MRRAKPLSQNVRLQQHILVVLFACVFLTFPLYGRLMDVRDQALRVWFFDVGQGDATLIETPSGKQILIDGGPDQMVLQKLPQAMWPWDRSLDAIVVTHPDADHITGLVSVLERYQVDAIYETGVRGGTSVITELSVAIDEEEAKRHIARAGQSFEYDGVVFDILWPTQQVVATEKDRNNTSIVLRVRYGDTTILLTGDAEADAETMFGKRAGDVDVLKVGHHGSRTSTSNFFLQAVTPEYAIISSGEDNRYGHPHPIVLSRLRDVGTRVWRTDTDGDIKLTSDGHTYSLAPALLPF